MPVDARQKEKVRQPPLCTRMVLATTQCASRHKENPMISFWGNHGAINLFQVLDLNQRSLRDGFTVRSLCPLGQPGSRT